MTYEDKQSHLISQNQDFEKSVEIIQDTNQLLQTLFLKQSQKKSEFDLNFNYHFINQLYLSISNHTLSKGGALEVGLFMKG